jgi:hypothetical protein
LPTVTKYYKIIGVEQQPDDSLIYTLREVADFTGASALTAPITSKYQTQPGANELPRGTIVKEVMTTNRQITINPTS